MKKLALLLGALTLVSGAAYAKEVVPVVEEVAVVEEAPVAAPALTVRYVGQGLEFDNESGAKNIGEAVHFSNSVGLAYGDDWTFDLMARKSWSMDTDDGIQSTGGYRIDLDAWRHFDNYSLGFRWRQEKDMDRYYARTKYQYGMFSGWIDAAYQSNNEEGSPARDGYYIEAEPVKVTVGPVTLGYYFKTESNIATGSEPSGVGLNGVGVDHWYRHQLRVAFPLYQGEKLNLSFQYGWEFANDLELDGTNASDYYTYKHDNNTHVLWLNYSYQVTENLSINGYYEYDMFRWEKEGDGNTWSGGQTHHDDEDSYRYYGEFFLGWTYTF